jgi:translation initiation factor 2 gamma subunit (eIF-2gamma)
VVGNKIDLVEKETVDEEEVVRFAKEKGIKYKRVSALSGVNINEMFKELADEYINSDDNVLSGMKINLLNKVKGKKGKKYC